MAVKKIETLNKHQNPATNENEFDIENYMNVNWDKIKEVVDNNADELTTTQGKVTTLETDNTKNKQDISSLKSRTTTLETDNETNKTNISTLQEDVEEIEGNIQQIQQEQTAQNKKIEQLDDNQIHITTEKAESINVQDASGQNAKINAFGISKQEGTPSPENPSQIQNTEGNVKITDCNENLVLNGYSTPKTDESFWNATSSRFEPLKDGWGKYVLNNTSSATQYINSFINFSKFKNIIKANTQYKLLVEIRNVSMSQTTESDFFCVVGATSIEAFLTYFQISQFETAKFEKIITSKANFDNTTLLLRSFLSVSANNNVSLEIRISLLEANSTETEIKIGNQEYIFPLAQNQKMMEGSRTENDGIHHKRKQIVLTGNEQIVKYTKTYPSGYGYRIILDDVKANTEVLSSIYNYENFQDFYWASDVINKITTHSEVGGYVLIGSSKATIEEFRQEIAGSVLEYETEEETIEAYTEAQQTVRNQLQNAKTYKTVTNVFADNAEVEMEYVAHTKTYINNEINSVKKELNTIKELLSTTTTSAMLLDNLQTDLESEVL